jgi:hypothetical protein
MFNVKYFKRNKMMNSKMIIGITCCMAVTLFGAGKGKTLEVIVAPVPLSAAGEALLQKYEALLKVSQEEFLKALPKMDEANKGAFLKAYQEETSATLAALQAMGASGGKKATDKAALAQAHTNAQVALVQAKEKAAPLAKTVLTDLSPFLSSETLDTALVKGVVLKQATPRGLAAFAEKGKEQEALVEQLLSNTALMRQMLEANGAEGGNYGQAMQIYTAIQKASPKAKEGILQCLALGTSLEQAVPIKQNNPPALTNAPALVDPVKRYLHFEKAYLDGELDPAFKKLSAWECRFVTNGDETEDALTWGREMLRNYRPDHISTSDYRWRYVKAVKTDVQYGSKEQVNDSPNLQANQNIINTGGVCGRRAFFGRFILRCFGIPTTARPQRGHATLVHFTPEGWVINLGAGWGWGWLKNNQKDVDFLAMTQARKSPKAFLQVARAQWIADLVGEKRSLGFCDEATGFWNGVALYRQRAIGEELKAVALAAVGTDIGEANVSKEADVIEKVVITEADKKAVVSADGTITIPAVACTKPQESTAKILFMKSFKDGYQLHYSRNGAAEPFEYSVEVPAAGTYALRATVSMVSPGQKLFVSANGAATPVEIALPYTLGMWEATQPVQVALVKGKNTLVFTRNDPGRGMSVKNFTLTPVK